MLRFRETVCLLALLFPGIISAQIVFGSSQAPGVTPPASNTPPEQRCVVQGRATNAQTGEPLKKVTIQLTKRATGPTFAAGPMVMPSGGQQGYSTTSAADGTFRIDGIEPGDYHLSGQRTGFLNTQYGAKGPMQAGTVLTLKPSQQMTDLNLGLIPQAIVSGKVIDEDGDPVQGAFVQVLHGTWQHGKLQYLPQGAAPSNDLGEFRAANMTPGKYYVCAQKMNFGMPDQQAAEPGKPDIHPVRTCYPDAGSLASATPLDIKAGQDLSDINIRMHNAATYHVRGKVAGNVPATDPGPGPGAGVNVTLSPREEHMFPFGGFASVAKNNTFDIAGVAPGSYTLSVFSTSGRVHGMGHQSVDVGQGDVDGLVLNIVPPGSLHAQLRVDGTPQAGAGSANLANVHVRLEPAEMDMMMNGMPNGQAKPDGSVTLENVSPGKYSIEANAPKGTYLKSIRFAGQELASKEVDLTQGASGELEIIFRYGPAEVDGTLQPNSDNSSSGQPATVPAASIVLLRDPPDPDDSEMQFGNTNQSGAFTMKNVPPGRYRAYAFEQIDTNQLENPELLKQLENRGTEIELKENDRKSIQLPLISSDDLAQLFAQLGIDPSQ